LRDDDPVSKPIARVTASTSTVSPAQPTPAEAVAAVSTAQPTPAEPVAEPLDGSPVWQPSPTIEFVEGVPAVVSVRQFVQAPDSDPLVIALQSGTLIPGLTWNPTAYTIAYDGRPLGAKPDAPVIVTGLTFTADDGRP
jgi:hypothetical protein